jgi:mono/diheme cytochrome c family protein
MTASRRRHRRWVVSAVVAAGSLSIVLPMVSAAPAASPPVAAPVDFARDVQPLLAAKCVDCHGPAKQKGGLRLDRPAALKGGDSGDPLLVPGDPAKSHVLKLVRREDPDEAMPPKAADKLDADQLDVLTRWVAQGGQWPPTVGGPAAAKVPHKHWSFNPPVRPPVPTVAADDKPDVGPSARNPIDAFVLARLAKEGLAPSPEADKYALARRVTIDLTGLPPTPAEVATFVADDSPGAYGRLVDRLLASPRFGERMARPWLDLARFADSAGYGSDPLRLTIHKYRDWVIEAFNANKPFDQFTVEQLAGDLLPAEGVSPRERQARLIATAFHRNTMTNTEGGTDDEEFRVAAVKDRTDVTVQVWMGLTMGCAQCHTHKFDPITNREYYQVFAIFNQTEDADRADEAPTIVTLTPAEEAEKARLTAEIAELERAGKAVAAAAAKGVVKPTAGGAAAGGAGVGGAVKPKATIADLRKKLDAVGARTAVLRELPAGKRRPNHVLVKGNFLNKGDAVEPGVLAAFNPLPAGAAADRLGLAKWLVARDNPLTGRVAVNRLWAQFFGTGLVETQEDFGEMGTPPSHPELLDWLAVEFVEPTLGPDGSTAPAGRAAAGGTAMTPWDVKRLVRLIVTSATYRQSAKADAERLAKDPRNRLLACGPRQRLEAEMVRDQALAAGGLLSPKMFGPSVYPPQPDGMWQAAFNGQRTYPTSAGEDRYRRGLYTFWRRTVPYPSMQTFDAPSREVCTVRRISTSTPLQAFVTMNDPVYVECSQAMGRRLVKEGGESAENRVRFGLRLVTQRPPTDEQVKPLVALFDAERAHYREPAAAEDAKKLATQPIGPLPPGADAADAAAWTVVANVLLNLDAAMTR